MQNLKNKNSRANLCGHQKQISGGINLPMQNLAVIDLTLSECCVYEKSLRVWVGSECNIRCYIFSV